MISPLLLTVQGLFQHELCEFVTVGLRLHVQVEVAVGGYFVCAQRVSTYIRIERSLERKAGSGSCALGYFHGDVCFWKTRWVVVDIHDLDFNAEQLERVLQKHLEMQQTAADLFTNALAVDFFVNEENPVFQVHLKVRSPRIQSQILGDISHERTVVRFLRYGVTEREGREMGERERERVRE
uniref:Uncharacterized protein n=1 Tax=Electrophorus electricus TaxID=8005 RepID=A0A4W4GHF9_ELEEL